MATTTSNLGLVKPTEAEYALVTEINANSDKIDAEVGKERSNFALVQNGDTATQAISQGQLVVWKGVLKKASANIASGATLSSSNLTDDSIAAELASLNSKIANKANSIYTEIPANTSYTFELKSGRSAIIILMHPYGSSAGVTNGVYAVVGGYNNFNYCIYAINAASDATVEKTDNDHVKITMNGNKGTFASIFFAPF